MNKIKSFLLFILFSACLMFFLLFHMVKTATDEVVFILFFTIILTLLVIAFLFDELS